MNRTETVLLCRYAKAMCPAQAIDEYTPDAWADVLSDVTLEEAKTAIQDGIRNRGWRFIDVTDVVAGARAQRTVRLNEWSRQFGPLLPPRALDADPVKEQAWLLDARRKILDGEVTHPSQLTIDPPMADLPVRNVDALGQLGRPRLEPMRVPDAPREAMHGERAAASRAAHPTHTDTESE
jgi:hypothetical protein